MVNNRRQFEHHPDDHDEQVAALIREIGVVCSNNPVGVVVSALVTILADVGVAAQLYRHTFVGIVVEELLGGIISGEERAENPDPRELN